MSILCSGILSKDVTRGKAAAQPEPRVGAGAGALHRSGCVSVPSRGSGSAGTQGTGGPTRGHRHPGMLLGTPRTPLRLLAAPAPSDSPRSVPAGPARLGSRQHPAQVRVPRVTAPRSRGHPRCGHDASREAAQPAGWSAGRCPRPAAGSRCPLPGRGVPSRVAVSPPSPALTQRSRRVPAHQRMLQPERYLPAWGSSNRQGLPTV